MADDGLEAEARRLYAGERSGFVAARNARAAELRAGGRDELAAAVKALPKASAAADAVNRVVREDPELTRRLTALGARFRRAQARADREAMRALGTERGALLDEVADRLRAASATPAVLADVARTALAAVADPRAAAAWASGRLLRSLEADGVGPVDLAGAVAGPPPPEPPAEDTAGGGDVARTRVDTSLAERRAVRALESARRAAEGAVRDRESAERARDEAHRARVRAEEELVAALERATGAEAALERARAAEEEALRTVGTAEAERESARR